MYYEGEDRPHLRTVGDLKAALKGLPDDMPIRGCWESISTPMWIVEVTSGIAHLHCDQDPPTYLADILTPEPTEH